MPSKLKKDIEVREDRLDKAAMVHLVRPADVEYGDKVYLNQVIEHHPDLANHIHQHVYDEATSTEHVIMDAFVFALPIIQRVFLNDCKFSIDEFVDMTGHKMNVKKQAAAIMDKVNSIAQEQY